MTSPISPWESVQNPSFVQVLSTMFGLAILAPIRVVLLVPLCVSCAMSMKMICLSRFVNSKHFSKLQKLTELVTHFYVRCILFIAGFYSITVKGSPTTDQNVRGIVANHSSWIDTIIMASLVFPSFIAKSDTKRIPLAGSTAKSWLSLFIDRSSNEDRQRALVLITERMRNTKLPPLIAFPEGGTSNGKYLTKFQRGPSMQGYLFNQLLLHTHLHLNLQLRDRLFGMLS
ncbi:hypothetical protein GEMRC1_006196 [Eukaryota sp. GEM-RC1]